MNSNIMYAHHYFIVRRVTSMGGAELLLLRRANLYKDMGVDVKIIVMYDDYEFMLKQQFEKFPILKIEEFGHPFNTIRKKRLREVVNKAERFLADFEDAIIESQTFQTAVWAEYLVLQHPTMRHIMYSVDDRCIYNYHYFPYSNLFLFKKKRGELWGTEREGLRYIFRTIQKNDDDFLPVAFDVNELVDETEPKLPKEMLINKCGFTISTLGRLDKGYIQELLEACLSLCETNPGLNITVIVGGGSTDKSIEKNLREKYSRINEKTINFRAIFLGYVIKIGKDFYKSSDIFVGLGTASVNSISQGTPTINYDIRRNCASGIFGLNLFNFAKVENDRCYDLKELIKNLLLNSNNRKEAGKAGEIFYQKTYTIEATLKKEEKLLNGMAKSIEPYNFTSTWKEIIKDNLRFSIWLVYKCFNKLFYPNKATLRLN